MKIGNFDFSEPDKCLIVAELSANHAGKLETALETIKAAAAAGADAIKLQTYTPDTISLNCDNEYFRIAQDTIWDGRTLYDLYKEAYTPWEWHEKLFDTARKEGLLCFSSPFDKTAVDFLEKFDPPAYKIASFEITDIPLIEYVASRKRPVIISTGIAEEEDIHLALETCRKANNHEIILLKCTSSYPAPADEANIRTIADMPKKFGVPAGLSDHTPGWAVPVASIALGARLIEKHFILDRNLGGPDASFSMEPAEFKTMCEAIRTAEKALGSIIYSPSPSSIRSKKFRRSLFAVKDIKEGDIFTEENIASIRPGDGLHPRFYTQLLGKKAKRDIPFGNPLNVDDIEG
jgi:pseudaminic acid synthase